MSKEKLIPELRFPEFDNNLGWDEVQLGDLCEVITKGTTPTTLGFKYTEDGVNFIKIESIENGLINHSKVAHVTVECHEALKRSQLAKNDILFSIAGALGVVATVREQDLPANINQALALVRLKKDVSQEYVNKYLNSPSIGTEILKIKAGAAQPNISLTQVGNFKVLLPNEVEQQKIASCLSSLDELIAAHNDKLDALKDHKKGLLQKLFPQEGETVPKVRFPEFEGDGEWVETTIEELIREKILFPPKDGNHGSIHPKSSDYVKTGIPFIMASDLKNGKIDFSKCAYLKKEQADLLQKGFAKNGDVLLTHKGTVGEVALLGELEYPYIMLTPQVTYYRIKDKSRLVNGFLAAFFNSDFFQKNLLKVSGGGTRAYVGITKQKEFDINFPKNPKEQQKIASCLSAVDELITAQQEKMEQLQQHKKGLMQGLFPKMTD